MKSGPDRDLRIFLWAVVLVLALVLYLGAQVAKAAPKQKPTWEEIAAFYSGGNMRGPITFDYADSNGSTGSPMSGNIRLNPKIKQSLEAFLKYGPRSQQGMVLGALGLSTLIHEAIHNRNFAGPPDATGYTPWLEDDQRGPSGFYGSGNEAQATDLGWRLIPDALQRFFGIPIDSKWGKKYINMVMKQLGSR